MKKTKVCQLMLINPYKCALHITQPELHGDRKSEIKNYLTPTSEFPLSM